jgi:hypothetical protein
MKRKQKVDSPSNFDDFLLLENRKLDAFSVIVFSGISGSGKTTALNWLSMNHPDFDSQEATWIRGTPILWRKHYDSRCLFVDELTRIRDMFHVRRLAKSGHRIVAASHLPEWFMRGLLWDKGYISFRTDRDLDKIRRYLEIRGVSYDDSTLEKYSQKYGMSYSDLEIVLSHTGANNLGMAMKLFDRHCEMDSSSKVQSKHTNR